MLAMHQRGHQHALPDAFPVLLDALRQEVAVLVREAVTDALRESSVQSNSSPWLRLDELEEYLRGRDVTGRARGFSTSKIVRDPALRAIAHKHGRTLLWHRQEVDELLRGCPGLV